jgi:MFS transporter, DHA3 family, tetracycline resistance protein
MRHRLPALTVYLVIEFVGSLLMSVIFTVSALYQVTVVRLDPLQIVLVGTVLETSVFLFEIPTGVLADVKSRRLSIIVGYVLMGCGFIVEASWPLFVAVACAQGLWGLGYTFTSGATQAWIADEVGEERAGAAFIRGHQVGRVGSLVAIPLAVALGSVALRLPILLGGLGLISLAGLMAFTMPEQGFRPPPHKDRTPWHQMAHPLVQARALVARQPLLLALLGIGLFYGLSSEGLDRLWTPHLLSNFALPGAKQVETVVWFGALRAVNMLLSLGMIELARRRVDLAKPAALGRALLGSAGIIIVGLASFALTRNAWLALGCFLALSACRAIIDPLSNVWMNQRIGDPQVRATLFSVSGQVDAVGQIVGGPLVGLLGRSSIRLALVASALLLTPVIPLYGLAMRRSIPAQPKEISFG